MHATKQTSPWKTLARAGTLATLLAAGAAAAAPAAPEVPRFQAFEQARALPQQQVIALHQDSLGFLWVGTYAGVARFGGDLAETWSTAEGLAANTIQAFASEADGTVWVGTPRGLCVLYRYAERFECPGLDGLRRANVHALVHDGRSLWVGAAEGLFRTRREGGAIATERVLGDVDVRALAVDAQGRVLVGGLHGLLSLDADGSRRAFAPAGGWQERSVQSLAPDGAGVLVGTSAGLYRLHEDSVEPYPGLEPAHRGLAVTAVGRDPEGRLWATSTTGVLFLAEGRSRLLGVEEGLSNEHNHALVLDRTGTPWLGSDGGLSRAVSPSFRGYLATDGLLQDFVRAINQDGAGRLWLGTRRGVQVVEVDADGALRERFRIEAGNGLVDERIYAIDFDGDDALLATGHGLARWRTGIGLVELVTAEQGVPDNATRAVRVTRGGEVWLGTRTGVVRVRDGRAEPAGDPELDEAFVLRIREDAGGALWFATIQAGLLRRGPDGAVRRFDAAAGLSDEIIWDVAIDSGGTAWAGSNGDGLFAIAPDGGIRRFTTSDGLVDNFVWQVLVDDQGQVWSYTNRGLSRFDGEAFWNYGRADGLLHEEGSATAALQAADGSRWFAAASGLMRYTGSAGPAQVERPRPRVLRARVDGRPLQPGADLAAGAGAIEFSFSAPQFGRGEDLRYRYRLRGAGDAWSVPIPQRPVTYAGLGPGDYVFELQARSADGEWTPEPEAFAFQVSPPWWSSPWWAVAGVLAVLALAWALMRWRIRQVEARRAELEAEVAERTRELEIANRRLEEVSLTDPLTGLRNRRFLARQIGADIAQSRRAHTREPGEGNRDIIFMMVDIDHFKQINDRHGHSAGDEVLRQYAELIRDVIRESDYAVRWGGEEFLVIARQADATQCWVLAERLCRAVRSRRFGIGDGHAPIHSTCSIGLSHYPFAPEAHDLFDWEQVLEICDAAVYLAKDLGRDGWVAIQAQQLQRVEDAISFVRDMKADPQGFARENGLRVQASRLGGGGDPEAADPGRDR
ncbi:MAG: diguanylate cyclase [Lysobacteraceae bacterium]